MNSLQSENFGGTLPAVTTIPWRGLALAARRFDPPAVDLPVLSRPAVLFIHGWQGAQDANDVRLAAGLARKGLTSLTFDLAGHGLSEGDASAFTLADFLDQALAAFDHLAQLAEVAPEGIRVCGASLGACLAVLLSARRPLAALSLRVPANYPDEVFAAGTLAQYVDGPDAQAWRSLPLPAAASQALRALRQFRGPVQIVAAGRDEIIPLQTVENYVRAADAVALEYRLLANATHVIYEDAAAGREAHRLLRRWLLAGAGLDSSDFHDGPCGSGIAPARHPGS